MANIAPINNKNDMPMKSTNKNIKVHSLIAYHSDQPRKKGSINDHEPYNSRSLMSS